MTAKARALIVVNLPGRDFRNVWPRLRDLGLGRLPGDIVIERGNVHIYLPIVTCIVVSVVLSLILWLMNR